ncbi:MAG: PilZ domain-containing protein [Rhodospirillaceae bacterium]
MSQTETLLLKILDRVKDEAQVAGVADVLRSLSSLRMRMEVPSGADQRVAARIHERAVVEISCVDGARCEGALHDISAGGALVECDMPLAAGARCSIALAGSAEPIPATARARHEGVTHFSFDKLPPARHVALVKHIERYFGRY